MPELPEVENVVRGLREHIIGQTISGAEVFWNRTVQMPEASNDDDNSRGVIKEAAPTYQVDKTARFRNRLRGQSITAVTRRGKHIILHLSEGDSLIVHLRMTGQMLITPVDAPLHKHTRLTWKLDDNRELRFVDQRKFGRVWLTDDPAAFLAKLGPEPLSDEFTPQEMAKLLQRKARIKPLLLNQHVLAGLGNIYVDEALFRAGVHPLRAANSLDAAESDALYHAIRYVLRRGIENGGTTFDGTYLNVIGETGNHQEELRVYKRAGEPCYRCGAAIERIVVGGRGTHFCPQCQREDGE